MKAKYIKTIHPTGYPIDFEIDSGDDIKSLIHQLQQQGYRPGIAGDTWPRTPEGKPLCPKHGAIMTKREKQGDCWHSHKVIHPVTNQSFYCRGYPSVKSQGYFIDIEIGADKPEGNP